MIHTSYYVSSPKARRERAYESRAPGRAGKGKAKSTVRTEVQSYDGRQVLDQLSHFFGISTREFAQHPARGFDGQGGRRAWRTSGPRYAGRVRVPRVRRRCRAGSRAPAWRTHLVSPGRGGGRLYHRVTRVQRLAARLVEEFDRLGFA